jgi:hypothetical protein
MIIALYRKVIPVAVREKMYDFFLGRFIFFIRHFKIILKSKLTFLFSFLLSKSEKNKAYSFMGKHGLTSYPYNYALEYQNKEIIVEKDNQFNLSFVMHNGKKLYFPEHYSNEKIKKDYRALLIEQDARSAHRYVRSYDDLKDKILLDVGAAEGIFSLDTIELTKGTILFECMEYWQKPLTATFARWTGKVTLVKKYVGDKSIDDFIALDDYFSNKPINNLFIKMDIEGAERAALEGARSILNSGKNVQAAICTYHRAGDPEFMDAWLKRAGYSTEFSDGLMYWNKRVSKGVIRAKN